MYTITDEGMQALSELTKTERRLLRGLFEFTRENELVAHATQKDLSAELSMGVSSVHYAYSALKKANFITPVAYGRTAINPSFMVKGPAHLTTSLMKDYKKFRAGWHEREEMLAKRKNDPMKREDI